MNEKPKASKIRQTLADQYGNDLLFADGFDSAIIGVIYRCGLGPVVCYDQLLCLVALVKAGMTVADAH